MLYIYIYNCFIKANIDNFIRISIKINIIFIISAHGVKLCSMVSHYNAIGILRVKSYQRLNRIEMVKCDWMHLGMHCDMCLIFIM